MQLKKLLFVIIGLIIKNNNYVYSDDKIINILNKTDENFPSESNEINQQEKENIEKYLQNQKKRESYTHLENFELFILKNIAKKIFNQSSKISIQYIYFLTYLSYKHKVEIIDTNEFDQIYQNIQDIKKNKKINNNNVDIKKFILLIVYIISNFNNLKIIDQYLTEIKSLKETLNSIGDTNECIKNSNIILQSNFFSDIIQSLENKLRLLKENNNYTSTYDFTKINHYQHNNDMFTYNFPDLYQYKDYDLLYKLIDIKNNGETIIIDKIKTINIDSSNNQDNKINHQDNKINNQDKKIIIKDANKIKVNSKNNQDKKIIINSKNNTVRFLTLISIIFVLLFLFLKIFLKRNKKEKIVNEEINQENPKNIMIEEDTNNIINEEIINNISNKNNNYAIPSA